MNLHALDVNSDLIAFAQLTFAYSTESVNGVRGKKVPGPPTALPAPAGPEGTFAGGDGGHGPGPQPRNEAANPDGGGPRDRPQSNPWSGSRGNASSRCTGAARIVDPTNSCAERGQGPTVPWATP